MLPVPGRKDLPGPGWGNPNTGKWGEDMAADERDDVATRRAPKKEVGRVGWPEKRVTPRARETHRQRRCREREMQKKGRRGGREGSFRTDFAVPLQPPLWGPVLMTPCHQHLLRFCERPP